MPVWEMASIVFLLSGKMWTRVWFLSCPGSSYVLLLAQPHTSLTNELSSNSFFSFFNSIFCKILFYSYSSYFPGQFKFAGCIAKVKLWWVGISVPGVICWITLLVPVLLRCGDWKVPEQMQEDVPALGTCWRIPKRQQHLAETETLLIQQATKICV